MTIKNVLEVTDKEQIVWIKKKDDTELFYGKIKNMEMEYKLSCGEKEVLGIHFTPNSEMLIVAQSI